MKKVLTMLLLFLLLNSCTEDFEIPESWSEGVFTTAGGKSEFCMFHYNLSGEKWFYIGVRDSVNDASLLAINLNGSTTDYLSNDSSELERIIEFSQAQNFRFNGISTTLHSINIKQQTVMARVTQESELKDIHLNKKTDWFRQTLPEGLYSVEIDSQTITIDLKQRTFTSYTLAISDEQGGRVSYTVNDNMPSVLGDTLVQFSKEVLDKEGYTRALPPHPVIYSLNGRKYTGFDIVFDSGSLFFKADYNNFYDSLFYSSGYVLMKLM